MILLEITAPSGESYRRSFEATPVSIGRETGELQLQDPEISAIHGELDVLHGTLRYRDLGSTNGSYLASGKAINSPLPLRQGDSVRVGKHRLCLIEFAAPVAEETLVDDTLIMDQPAFEHTLALDFRPKAKTPSATWSPANSKAISGQINTLGADSAADSASSLAHPKAPVAMPAAEHTLYGRPTPDKSPAAPAKPGADHPEHRPSKFPAPGPVAHPGPRSTTSGRQVRTREHESRSTSTRARSGEQVISTASLRMHWIDNLVDSLQWTKRHFASLLVSSYAPLALVALVAFPLALSLLPQLASGLFFALAAAALGVLCFVWSTIPAGHAICQLLCGQRIQSTANWQRLLRLPFRVHARLAWLCVVFSLLAPLVVLWQLWAPVLMLEQRSAMATLSRSSQLMQHRVALTVLPLLCLGLMSLPVLIAPHWLHSSLSAALPPSLAWVLYALALLVSAIFIAGLCAAMQVHMFRVYFCLRNQERPGARELFALHAINRWRMHA